MRGLPVPEPVAVAGAVAVAVPVAVSEPLDCEGAVECGVVVAEALPEMGGGPKKGKGRREACQMESRFRFGLGSEAEAADPKSMRIAREDDLPELMDVAVPVPVEKLVGREIEVTACAKALQVSTAF